MCRIVRFINDLVILPYPWIGDGWELKMEMKEIDVSELENDVNKSLCRDCDILIKEESIVVNTDLSGINFSYIEDLRKILKERYQLGLVYIYSFNNMINFVFTRD